MVTLRDELTSEDMVSLTGALQKLRPDMKDLTCIGVEVPQPNDKSVVFHVTSNNDRGVQENSIILISAQLLLEMFGGTGNVAERGH